MRYTRISTILTALIVLAALITSCGGGGGGGSTSGSASISPSITSVSPSSFSNAGNVTLTVVGTGFISSGTLATAELTAGPSNNVSIFLLGSSHVTINSDTSATVVIPTDATATNPPESLASFATGESNIQLVLVWNGACTNNCPNLLSANSPTLTIN